MTTERPKSISRELLSLVAWVAYPVLVFLGVASFIWIPIRAPFNEFPEPSDSILFSLGWYWLVGGGIASVVAGFWIWQFSPQREREDKAKEEKQEAEKEQKQFIQSCSNWFWAFKNGAVSEYPTTDPIKHGLLMRPGEVCYLAAPGAILGRGNAHQLEISKGANAGIDLKALKLGGKEDRKDSYSRIVYDEAHPGTLLITSQRITFVSPPSVFLDIAPSQIVTAAWSGTYIMLRTTIAPEENKNLLAFSLTNRGPAWLYVSAMLRLAEDHANKPNPLSDE